MMKNYSAHRLKGPDVWETSARGCLAALGAPFILLGFLGVGASLGVVRAEDAAPWPVLLCAGLALLSVGVVLVFGRGGVVIDRRQKKLTKWFGLGVTIVRKEFKTDSFEFVTFSRSLRSAKGGPETVYSVGLKGGGGPVVIDTYGDYKTARAEAEELALFLGKSVEDSSIGAPVVRTPGPVIEEHEEEPGAGTARTTGTGALIEPPESLRSRVTFQNTETTVDIPERGFNAGAYLSLAVGTFAPVFIVREFIIPFIRQMGSSTDVLYLAVFYFLTIVPTFVTWSGVLSGARKRTTVHASPLGLSLEESGVFRDRSITVPASEIEELFVTGGAGLEEKAAKGEDATGGFLLLKSAQGVVVFGHGLSVVELKYLQAVIKTAMAG